MDRCLLVVIVSPSLEHAVVDWLLDREDVPGFTSIPVFGHGASASSMSPAEQVAGRQRRVMFQLHLDRATAEAIIQALHAAFAGSGMHYWLAPLVAAGHLS